MDARKSDSSTATASGQSRVGGAWSAGSILFWSLAGGAGVVSGAAVAFRMASMRATRSEPCHLSSCNLSSFTDPPFSRFCPRLSAASPSPAAAGPHQFLRYHPSSRGVQRLGCHSRGQRRRHSNTRGYCRRRSRYHRRCSPARPLTLRLAGLLATLRPSSATFAGAAYPLAGILVGAATGLAIYNGRHAVTRRVHDIQVPLARSLVIHFTLQRIIFPCHISPLHCRRQSISGASRSYEISSAGGNSRRLSRSRVARAAAAAAARPS